MFIYYLLLAILTKILLYSIFPVLQMVMFVLEDVYSIFLFDTMEFELWIFN